LHGEYCSSIPFAQNNFFLVRRLWSFMEKLS
jgi:hypothetical protein